MALRRELLHFDTDDGGLDILDLVLEQVHHFAPDEAALIRAGAPSPELAQRLEQALLIDGPVAAMLRDGCRHARVRPRMPAPELASGAAAAAAAWELAAELPDFVTATWRAPERWRRLAEDRLAGRELLRLEGLVEPEHALAARAQIEALAHGEHHSMYAHARGRDVADGEVEPVLGAFRGGPLHALLGHVMGEALPARIFARSWILGPGDDIAVHADGRHYVTTFSLGLCPDWSAARGGAIAFVTPGREGFAITERWLPHLGDLLLFRPTATAWHAVEPVRDGTRVTLTGHYVAPSYPG